MRREYTLETMNLLAMDNTVNPFEFRLAYLYYILPTSTARSLADIVGCTPGRVLRGIQNVRKFGDVNVPYLPKE